MLSIVRNKKGNCAKKRKGVGKPALHRAAAGSPIAEKRMMKKMNKVAAAVLAVAMVGSMAVPALAVDGSDYNAGGSSSNQAQNARNTTLTYTVRESYTWTIHDAIDFTQTDNAGKGLGQSIVNGADTKNKVTVSDSTLKEGNVLQITAKGNGGEVDATNATNTAFAIKNRTDTDTAGTNTLTYDVASSAKTGADSKVTTGGTVLVVKPGAKTGETDMTFTLHTATASESLKAETAGTYQGYIIYTANIVKADAVTDFN